MLKDPNWIQCWKIKEAYDLGDSEITELLMKIKHRVPLLAMTIWGMLFRVGTLDEKGERFPLFDMLGDTAELAQQSATEPCIIFSLGEKSELAQQSATGPCITAYLLENSELAKQFATGSHITFSLREKLLVELLRVAGIFERKDVENFFLKSLFSAVYGEDVPRGFKEQVISLTEALFTARPDPDPCKRLSESIVTGNGDFMPKYMLAGNDVPFPYSDYHFFCQVFADSIELDKASVALYLHRYGYPLQKEFKGLSKKLVDELASVTAKPVSNENIPEQQNNAMTFGAWEGVVKDYERNHKKRKNDALPRRMEILIKHLKGTSVTVLQLENPGYHISRDLAKAKNDVIRLKKLYPSLLDLPKYDMKK